MPFRLILAAAAAVTALSLPLRAETAASMERAMIAVARKDWSAAMNAADGPLVADVVEWERLRAGEGRAADYADFLARRPDWPGLPLLRKMGEASLAGADPQLVTAYFATAAPTTGAGAAALVEAHLALGQVDAAIAAGVAAWRGLAMDAASEAQIRARLADRLEEHHGARMAMLLSLRETEAATRMLPMVSDGTRAVAAARIALQKGDDGVDALIGAVPARMAASGGLAYDRFRWRLAKDRDDEAVALLLERSASADSLGDPALWAEAREAQARRLMREGRGRDAYAIAARHYLAEGETYAQLEWLAGYIALRKLDDADTALAHFRRFRAQVATPISLARAGYWEGRAAEVLGRTDEARAAYGFAAEFQSAYYGQLAAERLGLSLDPALAGGVGLPEWQDAAFVRSSVFQAGELLLGGQARETGERFFVQLAATLDRDELVKLASYALGRDRPHLALLIAKQAATRGIVLPRAYFPVTPLAEMDLPVPAEWALAIARRESEFDPAVASPAGAQGLMQVMPDTARIVAKDIGIAYERARLSSDWRYNARLGTAYLAKLRSEFGGSAILVAAGYNAGPGRPRRWITELGDPRSAEVDPIDWVEAVPFEETRNYIMRVAEALPIYRARLAGGPVPITTTADLRGN